MTEEEAKTKWCPMVRDAQGDDQRGINSSNDFRFTNCIASDCMMWRQSAKPEPREKPFKVWPHGYCGLGGEHV